MALSDDSRPALGQDSALGAAQLALGKLTDHQLSDPKHTFRLGLTIADDLR